MINANVPWATPFEPDDALKRGHTGRGVLCVRCPVSGAISPKGPPPPSKPAI